MKVTKTQLKDTIRNIWKEVVSWISIIVIAGIAALCFIGIRLNGMGLQLNVSRYYEKYNQADVVINSTKLLSDEDVKKIKEVPGVEDVETCWKIDGYIKMDEMINVKVVSLTNNISKVNLISGRLPENNTECVVQEDDAKAMDLELGDTVTITDGKNGVPTFLENNVFTVTGFANHPDLITDNKKAAGGYIMVDKSAFGGDLAGSAVMQALVKVEGAEKNENYFTNDHSDRIDEVVARLEELGAERSPIREEEMQLYMQEKADQLADAEKQLEEGKQKIEDGKKQISDGEKKLKDGKAELEDKRKLLDEGKKKLEAAEAKLAAGKAELVAGKAKLDSAKAQLDSGKAQLDEGKAQLAATYNQIEAEKNNVRNAMKKALGPNADRISWSEGNPNPDIDSSDTKAKYFYVTTNYTMDLSLSFEAQVDDLVRNVPPEKAVEIATALAEPGTEVTPDNAYDILKNALINKYTNYGADYDKLSSATVTWDNAHEQQYLPKLWTYYSKLSEYQAGLAKYEAGKAEYEAGLREYEAGKKEYEEGEKAYTRGLNDYRHGLRELQDAKKKLKEGEEEYADKLEEYNKGKEAYESAVALLEEISACKWIVTTQYVNTDYYAVKTNSAIYLKLSVTLSLFFVIIAAVVIYATVGKIIDEQKKLVGTTKAFGFWNSEISFKYYTYAVTASLAGGITGALLGSLWLQSFGLQRQLAEYNIGDITLSSGTIEIILAILISGLIAAFAVGITVNKMLQQPATDLLRGDMPKGLNGESSGRKKKSLLTALIFRNMRVDMRRVVVMLASVAGCTLLLLLGLTIRFAINNAIDKQYEEVILFDETVTVNEEISDAERKEIEDYLEGQGASFIDAKLISQTFRDYNGDYLSSNLYVGDPSELQTLFKLKDSKGREITLSDEGIYITDKTEERQKKNKENPDNMTLYDSYMNVYEIPIKGVYTSYIDNFFIMSSAQYEEAFGKTPVLNAYLVKLNGADKEVINEHLKTMPGFTNTSDFESKKAHHRSTVKTIDLIIIILVIMAILMSYFIQNNLINMYLNQKKKELSVMRINGFSIGEVTKYMATELVVITAAGILVGDIVGFSITDFMVGLMEAPTCMLVHSPSFLSLLIASLITLLFSVIIITFAVLKIRKLNIRDAMS